MQTKSITITNSAPRDHKINPQPIMMAYVNETRTKTITITNSGAHPARHQTPIPTRPTKRSPRATPLNQAAPNYRETAPLNYAAPAVRSP